MVRVPAFGEAGVKKVYNGAICYTPRRLPDRRPGLGPRQPVAQRGPQLRHHRRRRRRLAARRVDRRRRAHDRHDRGRPAPPPPPPPPLRRLRHARLPDPEERGGLRPRLRDPLPRRGAPRRPAAQDDALLRPDEGARRGVRPELRLGASELVRPRGRGGRRTSTASAARTGSSTCKRKPATCPSTPGCSTPARSPSSRCTGPARKRGSTRSSPTRCPRSDRLGLAHLLTSAYGGVRSEFTIYRKGPARFYLVCGGAYERHDEDVLREARPRRRLGHHRQPHPAGGRAGAGGTEVARDPAVAHRHEPRQRGLPVAYRQAACRSRTADTHALRVNYVGELGWELHHPMVMQNALFDAIMERRRGRTA